MYRKRLKLDRSRRRRYTRNPFLRKSDVTVCVAAICNDGKSLVGASDRMITAGTQYLSPEPKVFLLRPSIVAMWSGLDVDFIHGILAELLSDMEAKGSAMPNEPLGVKEFAYGFRDCFNRARNRLMSQDLLARFDMTPATFPRANWEKHPNLVNEMAGKMAEYPTPDTQVLVVGVDRLGAHIYEFENLLGGGGNVHCYDGTGFRAIGAGEGRAHSQLELANYGRSRPEAEALFLVYLAKKRADVVTGVSEMTDVFLFAPGEGALPRYAPLDPESKTRLHKIYVKLQASEETALARAMKATTVWRSSLQLPTARLRFSGGLSATFAPTVIIGKGEGKASQERSAEEKAKEGGEEESE